MPIRKIPNTDQNYYLINHDSEGNERKADDGRMLSQIVLDELKTQPITDVFVFSHGWLGDIDDAQNQYDRWTANLWSCAADIELMKQKRPGFRPMLVGLHWPSKPFGNEDTGGAFDQMSTPGDAMIDEAVNEQLALLAAPESIRPQLETIFNNYRDLGDPESLPNDVLEAYLAIDQALGLADEEREGFDPETVFQNALEADQEAGLDSFGGFGFGDLLAPLRALSFWRMKQRARTIGESGGSNLLRKMHEAKGARDVRFHLMGHSFGCIVVSTMAAGKTGSNAAAPVNSLMLVQGALSIWAYAPQLPHAAERGGYLHPLIKQSSVRGAIVTTQSEHDSAVGFWYPLAARVRQQDDFAELDLPTYGAIGEYGIRGLESLTTPIEMKKKDEPYGFATGRIYNLESSHVIRDKSLVVGAHSDIAHPEVAHAWWQAAMV